MTTKKPAQPPSAAALRRTGVARLKAARIRNAAQPRTKADRLRLVHELRVYQLELEMQSEELARSRTEVEAGLKRYIDLYDFAPTGYFTLARDGTIREAILSGARLLRLERNRLIKRRFGTFVTADCRGAFSGFLANVFTGRGKESCELTLRVAGGELLWAYIKGKVEDGQECHAMVLDITKRKLAQEEIRSLSIHDALTGLYNRRFFEQEMARLERGRQFPVRIVMVNVDHLNQSNDSQGHDSGDAVLVRVAQLLATAFRAEDMVARIGGDEFGVLLPGTSARAAKLVLRRVRRVLADQNAAGSGKPIGLSIGVSTALKAAPLVAVLKAADAIMYREKLRHDGALEYTVHLRPIAPYVNLEPTPLHREQAASCSRAEPLAA